MRYATFQSGIGVRAIRITAKTAPANAAAATTAITFLLSFFLAALQISAAQATQTTAAAMAIPIISHNQDNSYKSLIYFPSSSVNMFSRNLSVPDFVRRFFVSCAQISSPQNTFCHNIMIITEPKGQKSDASLLAGGFLASGPWYIVFANNVPVS